MPDSLSSYQATCCSKYTSQRASACSLSTLNRGWVGCVNQLIQLKLLGPDLMDKPFEDKETTRGRLFAAAWRGQREVIEEIIGGKKVNINSVDENNVTALRFTSQYGHFDLTSYLLDHGADPNIKAHDRMDPLLAAVEQGHKEIVVLLLERGANVKTRTKETNALLLAREKGHTDIEEVLVNAGATESMGLIKDKGCRLS